MSARSAQKGFDPLLEETVRMVWDLSHRLAEHMSAVAASHRLTPAQLRAVMSMAEPAPMRDLAGRLGCDKSNVTGLIDGLEEQGLVIRETDPHDRRIKQLSLTTAGRRLRTALETQMHTDIPAIGSLDPARQKQLHELLREALYPDGVIPSDC